MKQPESRGGGSPFPAIEPPNPTVPPKHLSKKAKARWLQIVADFHIDDWPSFHRLEVIHMSYDAMLVAEADVKRNGQVFTDRWGQVKENPSVRIARDARAAYLKGMASMNFDAEPLAAPTRPAR